METKRNLKYFTSKGINPVIVAGACVILLGLILLLVPTTKPIGMVIILVGVGVAVFGSGAKSGEADIDNQIIGCTKDMYEQAMIKHEVYEKHFISIIKPIFLRGFDFKTDGIYCKKGPDHKYRTSIYNAVQLFFTRDRIYVYGKHISLVDSGEEANYEYADSYLYADIKGAYIEETTFDYNGRAVNAYYFALKKTSGEDIFRFTVEYGADVDKAADDINHVIQKMAEKAEERAAQKAAKRAALNGSEPEYV